MDYTFSKPFADLAPSAIREILKSSADPETIAFAAGNPAPESFPSEAMATLAEDILRKTPALALQYGTSEGYTPLRETLAARLAEKGKMPLEGQSLIITSGGQPALELACRVLCNPGDVVLCEDPTFIGALNAFRAAGARTVGVPMEADGMDIAALERMLRKFTRAKIIYMIPNFQNPRGLCTSYAKRRAIHALALRYGVVILEDDPYGEIRFSGKPIPAVKSLDTPDESCVVYCSSFSKLLSAGMRVGYALAPAPIAAKMVVGKQCEDVHTNQLFQILCHRYMTEYDFEAHLEYIRGIYRHKSSVMLTALKRYMPKGRVTYSHPEGGLFLFCQLHGDIHPGTFIRTAVARKVTIVPGQVFSPGNNTCQRFFRMTYATPTDEQIERGVKILADTLTPADGVVRGRKK